MFDFLYREDGDSQDLAPKKPFTRYVPGLEETLAKHEEWVRTNGASGRRAVFSGTWFESDVSFDNRDLRGALFNGVQGYRLFFRGTNLDEATFRGGVLKSALFTGASLVGADFRDARITGTFQDANLRYANFEGWVGRESTFFVGADLSWACFGDHEEPIHGGFLRSPWDREALVRYPRYP